MAPPRQRQAASDAMVFGVLTLLSASDNPDATFRTIDWIASRIAPVATVPARGASPAQLQLQGGYSDADADAVMQAVDSAQALHGPYAPGIRAAMLHRVDLPIATAQADPSTALAGAQQAIDELLQQSPAEALANTGRPRIPKPPSGEASGSEPRTRAGRSGLVRQVRKLRRRRAYEPLPALA